MLDVCFNSSRSKRWIALLVEAHANKKRRLEPNKHEDGDAYSEVDHKHLTPDTVLTVHAVTSLLYFQ